MQEITQSSNRYAFIHFCYYTRSACFYKQIQFLIYGALWSISNGVEIRVG